MNYIASYELPLWIDYLKDSNISRYDEFPRLPECEHPISIVGRLVPCGHCVLCQSRKKKEWINRNMCESRLHKTSCFMTLTFSDDNLEKSIFPTVQKFLKRLRKIYGKFRYFGCFEKGEKSGRPHFHILFYGFCPQKIKYKGIISRTINEQMALIWRQGFVKVDALCPQTISYVCGYVQKKLDKNEYKPESYSWREHIHQSKYNYDYVNKDTYFFMSKGIGYNYILSDIENICRKGFYVLNGYRKGLGKWIRDKLKRMNTYLSIKCLTLLDNKLNEQKENCELLPDYVLNWAFNHKDLIGKNDDDKDIYFYYLDFMRNLNLQKVSEIIRLRE